MDTQPPIQQKTESTDAEQQASTYEPLPYQPETPEQDRKHHIGLIVAIVAFACLIIGAGIAYAMLAPAGENREPIVNPSINENVAVNDNTDVVEPDVQSCGQGNTGSAGGNSGGSQQAPSRGDSQSSAQAAPDFTVYDLDDNKVSLSDFKGRPVVLNFWASWCGPCRSEMPEFQSAYEKYGSDVQFLMVDMTGMSGETKGEADLYIADNGFTFPTFYDNDGSAARTFAVTSIPQTYFIDADGAIVASQIGTIPSQALDRNIQKLLA